MTKQNQAIDLSNALTEAGLCEYDFTFFATVNNRDTHISYHLIENGSNRVASIVYETYQDDDDEDVLDTLNCLHNRIMRKWTKSHTDGC